jgi:hypothetical protein
VKRLPSRLLNLLGLILSPIKSTPARVLAGVKLLVALGQEWSYRRQKKASKERPDHPLLDVSGRTDTKGTEVEGKELTKETKTSNLDELEEL